MFVIQNSVAVAGVGALTAEIGEVGQTAIDDETNDRYVKLGSTWTKVADGAGRPVAPPVMGEVTLRNASGTVSRKLTAVDGIVTLAQTDALVTDSDVVSVENSVGGIKKNAKAKVAGGVIAGVQLVYTDTLVSNGDQGPLVLNGKPQPFPAVFVVSEGIVQQVFVEIER